MADPEKVQVSNALDQTVKVDVTMGTDVVSAFEVDAGDINPSGVGVEPEVSYGHVAQFDVTDVNPTDIGVSVNTEFDQVTEVNASVVKDTNFRVGLATDMIGTVKGDKGDKGDTGTGINIRGKVNTISDLPSTPAQGDAYQVSSENDSIYVWSQLDDRWIDCGPLRGPQGLRGLKGEQGIQGEQGVQGPRGVGWFTGNYEPPGIIPGAVVGDFYMAQQTGNVYQLTAENVADF